MRFFNEQEVEILAERVRQRLPQLTPYAQYVEDWVTVVNNNSDGWAFWIRGHNAALSLLECLSLALDGKSVTSKEWTRAVADIKSCATRRKLRAPLLMGGIVLKHRPPGNRNPAPSGSIDRLVMETAVAIRHRLNVTPAMLPSGDVAPDPADSGEPGSFLVLLSANEEHDDVRLRITVTPDPSVPTQAQCDALTCNCDKMCVRRRPAPIGQTRRTG
jgi:hypothetical protein